MDGWPSGLNTGESFFFFKLVFLFITLLHHGSEMTVNSLMLYVEHKRKYDSQVDFVIG